jgi:sporulation protein YqfD
MVEITCAEPEKVLEAMIQSGISIRNIHRKSDLVYQFSVAFEDYQIVSKVLSINNGKSVIVSRSGLYWRIKIVFCRPIFIILITVILCLTYFLTTRILFIELQGNQNISNGELVTAADQCGISFGALRKDIRSEKTKNQMLSLVPKLQWVGINTFGCRAVISVRERAEGNACSEGVGISNLVSTQDAHIIYATVTDGTPLVRPGDIVTEGQTLVSGYEDHGQYIKANRASGEVLGLTRRTVSAIMPRNRLVITDNYVTSYRISLLFRKKRINLWKDSRISDVCCGRMYKEYYISLPGGYRLPLAICVDRYYLYETESYPVAELDAYRELQKFSDSYLQHQMIAGQILQKQHRDFAADGMYLLESNYTCSEIISREQREQIGDQNGKRN